MPTVVHFIGSAEPLRLQEDYDKVIAKFHKSDAQVSYFGEDASRVAIYKSGIAYIIEQSKTPSEPFVAHA